MAPWATGQARPHCPISMSQSAEKGGSPNFNLWGKLGTCREKWLLFKVGQLLSAWQGGEKQA